MAAEILRAETDGANRAAAVIVGGFLVARLVFALLLGPGVDESYTLAISRALALSYFDHPPLHQWIVHFAAGALGEGIGARLPFILMFAATGWVYWRLTADLFGPRAGLVALFALNASPFFFASAGTWIVPDGPLLFGLATAAWALARLFFAAPAGRASVWALWLVAGVAFGVAGLSKYSAALGVLGLLAFVALAPARRRWFADPAPYAAAAVALAMIAPVVVWNARHGWVSFGFQGGRGAPGTGLKPMQVLAMALGEIAYLSPWLAAPLALGLVDAWRKRRDARRLFLLCLAAPPILLFTLTPLWGARGLPHWTMPGWFFVFALMGAWVADRGVADRTLRRWAFASAGLLAASWRPSRFRRRSAGRSASCRARATRRWRRSTGAACATPRRSGRRPPSSSRRNGRTPERSRLRSGRMFRCSWSRTIRAAGPSSPAATASPAGTESCLPRGRSPAGRGGSGAACPFAGVARGLCAELGTASLR